MEIQPANGMCASCRRSSHGEACRKPEKPKKGQTCIISLRSHPKNKMSTPEHSDSSPPCSILCAGSGPGRIVKRDKAGPRNVLPVCASRQGGSLKPLRTDWKYILEAVKETVILSCTLSNPIHLQTEWTSYTNGMGLIACNNKDSEAWYRWFIANIHSGNVSF